MKLHEFFNNSTRWTKGAFARDGAGIPCSATAREARSWCVLGAMAIVCPDPVETKRVFRRIKTATKRNVVDWQDSPERTFEQVHALLVKLNV